MRTVSTYLMGTTPVKLTTYSFISEFSRIYEVCFPLKTIKGKQMNRSYSPSLSFFTLATESEAESEAQGALRSSVNQKSESEAESEARRNRSQKDQKSFFFFRFRLRFHRFRSSENKVIRIGSRIISQSKNSLPVPFKLRARKNWQRLWDNFPFLMTSPAGTSKTTAKKG